jgi:glycosyltransferase involved in cell wall biosynthesis
MISVLILTKNEERDLPGCLASVNWSDDVHVFDSCSTDHTVEIARSHGALVTQRVFDNYSAQRNAALDGLPFKHSWIFLIDADERPTPELALEMQQASSVAPNSISGFRVRRRDFFQGTWLRHVQLLPFYVRLIRSGRARYIRDINEVLQVEVM